MDRPYDSMNMHTQPLFLIAGWAIACIAPAQAPDAEQLLADDWRARNAAAVALAKHPETLASDLLQVLRTDWQGHVPQTGLGLGGGGRFRSRDPRELTIESARIEIGHHWHIPRTICIQSHRELVGPWHPHRLAEWVLRQKATAADLPELKPESIELARIWLSCCKPSAAELEAATANEATAQNLVVARWQLAGQSNDLLREWITAGPPAARRAALRLASSELTLDEAALRGVIQQFLRDNEEGYRRNAGYHLVRRGGQAAVLLREHLGDAREDRQRALAALCIMGEHASVASQQLLICLQFDTTSQRRALVALSNSTILPEQQSQTATAIFEHMLATRSTIVRALSLDALGQLKEGMPQNVREQLVALLDEQEYASVRARLLGCLRQLGAVPKSMSLKAKVRLTEAIHPTEATWLTLADEGEAAGEAIRTAVCNGSQSRTLKLALLERLVQTAPELVSKWLEDDEQAVRKFAFQALANLQPERIRTAYLLGMLRNNQAFFATALDLLSTRADSLKHKALLLRTLADANITWTATRVAFVRRLAPDFGELLTAFETQLRRGQCWPVLLGMDDDRLRKHAREWLASENTAEVNDRLVAEIVALGLSQAVDIQAVERILRSQQRSSTLSALRRRSSVPAALIPALEAICDEPADSDYWYDDWEARELLILANR